MGRELRRVPENWVHPKDENGKHIPLLGRSYKKELEGWNLGKLKWDEGLKSDYNGGWVKREGIQLSMTWEEWTSVCPKKDRYMPEWEESEKTHIQLYENTTEGTPKSPIFRADQLEELCEYAALNCTTWGTCTATKDEWMRMIDGGQVYAQIGHQLFF